MKKLLAAIAILSFSCLNAQNDKPSRVAFALKVQVNAKQFYAQQITDSPYFAEEMTLQIYPDERVYIEAEVENGKIVSLQSVKENVNPEKTFDIEFCQTTDKNVTTASLLYINNPFDKKLKYDALLYVIDTGKWDTERHSAKSKLTALETWKNVLGSVVIRNWELE